MDGRARTNDGQKVHGSAIWRETFVGARTIRRKTDNNPARLDGWKTDGNWGWRTAGGVGWKSLFQVTQAFSSLEEGGLSS